MGCRVAREATAIMVLAAAVVVSGCTEERVPDDWGFGAAEDAAADLGPLPPDPSDDTGTPERGDVDLDTCEVSAEDPAFAACGGTAPDRSVFGWEEGHTAPNDLEVGPTGCPYVLYEQGDRVELATWSGEEWSSETVATNEEVSSSLHLESSLAVDRCSRPSVAYIDERDVYVARRGATGNWSERRLRELDGNVAKVDHAIGPDGRAAVLADLSSDAGDPEEGRGALVLAIREGGAWSTEEFYRGDSWAQFYDGLAFDGEGRAHVAFRVRSESVHHAVRRGPGRWSVERVTAGTRIHSPNIAVAPDDTPHIVVFPGIGRTEQTVRHFQKTSEGWESTDIDTEIPEASWGHSAAFDRRGNLHTVYLVALRPNVATEVRHASWSEGSWQVELLEEGRFARPAPRVVPDARRGILHTATMSSGPREETGLLLQTLYRGWSLDD